MNKKHRIKISRPIITILIILLTTACRQKQISLGDGGFLSSQNCSASCFLSIVPGVTKEADVVNVLKQNSYYNNCIFHKKTSESDSHGIVCFDNISISINNQDNVVEGIGFQPSTEILVSDVEEKYGQPDMVAVFTDESPFVVHVSLIYKQINTRLDLQTIDGSEYLVKPTSMVTRIIYFDPSTYSQMIAQSRAKEWQGFVIYSNK